MSAVLIVDDEPRIREIIARWLAPAGYDIRDAPDAETALSSVSDASPDVVLCDVQMPGHDGLWLVDQLRERFPTVAILLATADARVHPGVSMKSGVVDYLVKPLDRDLLLAAVARAVEWRKAAVISGAPRNDGPGDPLTDWLGEKRR